MTKCCHFRTFCKGYSKAKWLQNGRFWKRSSNQPTRWMIRPHVKETATSNWREHCHVFTWPYAIHFIPTNMVRSRVWGNLRMRKQNIKTTVPLDLVPERRTERFPPIFRPVGRCFWTKVQITIVNDRQAGRDKSATRPYIFFWKENLYLQIKMHYQQLNVTLTSRNLRIRSKQLATVIPKGPNNKVYDQRIFSEDNPCKQRTDRVVEDKEEQLEVNINSWIANGTEISANPCSSPWSDSLTIGKNRAWFCI